MVKVLGIDLGNAKTKLCLIETEKSLTEAKIEWQSIIVPFTRDRIKDFELGIPLNVEVFLMSHGTLSEQLDCVVVCCSHSYSYPEFHQSITHLAQILKQHFKDIPCFLISANGKLVTLDKILQLSTPELYAFVFTNFYGSAYLGSKLITNGLSLDIGTTTTDIIPIQEGAIDPLGLQEPENYIKFRYQHQRINWLGLTMTPLAMLANTITLNQQTYQVVPRAYASDLIFSLLEAMPHELMQEHAYFSHFPKPAEAREKMSQFIGLDQALVSESELKEIVNHLYQCLTTEVANRIRQVSLESFGSDLSSLQIAVFALGEQVLAKPALVQAGFKEEQFCYLNFRRKQDLWSASSAFAMGVKGLEWLLETELEIPEE